MTLSGGRLLRLLTLLGSRAWWTAEELADRLEVTTRTIRRDIDRLRGLGYPIEALSGPGGGYGFGSGGRMPPLLLDDDEAIAVAVGLRTASSSSIAGAAEAAMRASMKLEQALSPSLAAQVDAITGSIDLVGSDREEIDSVLFRLVAESCRRRRRVRMTYRDRTGAETDRLIDPYRLVHVRGRWYLVAHDRNREDWRTFRVDRIFTAQDAGGRAEYPNAPDAAELVELSISNAAFRYQAVIRFEVPGEELRRRIPPGYGVVEDDGPKRCILRIGSNYLDAMVGHLIALGLDFSVLEPPELVAEVGTAIERLQGSLGGHG